MTNKENLIKVLEKALYLSLTKGTDEFDNFYADFKDNDEIDEELNEAYRIFQQKKHFQEIKKEFRDFFKKLKYEMIQCMGSRRETLGNLKIFAYGFYNYDDDTPLYIGITKEGLTRVKHHFQFYSPTFLYFPMHYLDEIRIWCSKQLTEDNIERFEDYLIKTKKPYFNKKNSLPYLESEIPIYQDALSIEQKIPVSNYRDLFKKFS